MIQVVATHEAWSDVKFATGRQYLFRSAINDRFREFLVTLASSSSPAAPGRFVFLGCALQRIRAVCLKCVCAIILGRPTSPGAPGGLHTRGSLPLAQPKSRPLGKPFAPRGSPARGLAWRSPPRGGSPPCGADLPSPAPARVPAPQFPQQSPSPSPSPAPLFEIYAAPTRIPHSLGEGAWFACCV